MAQPNNPNTIILKNEYYPNGLTEQTIYNYYNENKRVILDNLHARPVVFFIIPDLNQTIVKRRFGGEFIKLNGINYDKLITGRTISIHATMKSFDDIGIIDVDCDDFELCKKLTFDVYKFIESFQFVKNTEIRFTGKNGFHILCSLDQAYDATSIRHLLKDSLMKNFENVVNIDVRGKKPNLDLSSNKPNGAFITLYSLSVMGLKCIPIKAKNIKQFRKNEARIK